MALLLLLPTLRRFGVVEGDTPSYFRFAALGELSTEPSTEEGLEVYSKKLSVGLCFFYRNPLPSPARPSDLGVSYLVHEPNYRRPSKNPRRVVRVVRRNGGKKPWRRGRRRQKEPSSLRPRSVGDDTGVVPKSSQILKPGKTAKKNVLGPVPEVNVMAKRPQGLLNVGDSFRADGGAAFLRSWHLAPCASPWQSAL
jgi:hypothetical protein